MRNWLVFTASILGFSPAVAEESQSDHVAHWAFRAPVAPVVPAISGGETIGNPIDAFIAVKHGELGLEPAPAARKHVLLRRVYFDLTGLPPSRQEIARFLADSSPDAYGRTVTRLLASPAYGERWGRHWMDVWRYADWSGEVNNQVRGSPRHIWRWRDWIIESVNSDKPYDDMILEMLAGDEIAPGDPDTLRATGFLARNWYKFNRNVWLDDTVEHTVKAFLALTFDCARCHDHKYDPFSQEDYYRLRAFFEPHDVRTDQVAGESDLEKDGVVRVFDAYPDRPTYRFIRGEDGRPDRAHPLQAGLPEALGGQIDIRQIPLLPRDGYPSTSTGRRLALARWIVNPRNPLMARVAVNHI